MMNSTADVLTIIERPTSLWFTGAMFGGFGLMMLLQGEASVVMGILFFLIGVLLVVNSPITTLTIERSRNQMVLHKRALIRQSSREIPLSDIANIEVQRSRSGRGGQSYRLAFILVNGTVLPMTSYYSGGMISKSRQADQIYQFLRLDERASADAQLAEPQAELLLSPVIAPRQQGETRGISWQMETGLISGLQVTRWTNTTSGFSGGLLLLVQKPAGGLKLPGGMLEGLTGLAYRRLLQLYGFDPDLLSELADANPLAPLDPGLEPYYNAYTTQPGDMNVDAARQFLSPWVVIPLKHWAEQNPIQAVNTTTQIVALFHPGGIELAALNLPSEKQRDLVNLGVDLAKETATYFIRPNQEGQP